MSPSPLSRWRTARPWSCAVLLAALAGCHSLPQAPVGPTAFATDGCSMFPDGLPGGVNWRGCCVAHDLAYWRGGSEDERRLADRLLRSCVAEQAHPWLGQFMYAGVRIAGVPSLPTSFRWGFGWPYGRGYQPVTESEDAELALLRASWLAANPPSSCDAKTL